MKVYIIPHPHNFFIHYSCPRGEKIVLDGLKELSEVELVYNPEEADIILLDYVPHVGRDKYNREFIDKFDASKLVVIDWQDEVENNLVDKYLAYFKRSWVIPKVDIDNKYIKRESISRPPNYFPFAYSCMKEYFGENKSYRDRAIDIGCYLRFDSPNRNLVLNILQSHINKFSGLNTRIGPVSSGSRSVDGKVYIDHEYFSALSNTKILITANPWWEGDMRTWEALSRGCCVLVDKMFTPIPNKLINRQHIVEYDISDPDSLLRELQYLVNDPYYAESIASVGNKFVRKYHMPKNRMQYVIKEIRGLL